MTLDKPNCIAKVIAPDGKIVYHGKANLRKWSFTGFIVECKKMLLVPHATLSITDLDGSERIKMPMKMVEVSGNTTEFRSADKVNYQWERCRIYPRDRKGRFSKYVRDNKGRFASRMK